MITDHAYRPRVGFHEDFCGCGVARCLHAGESPLNDGPVRSAVERQQERIRELEALVVSLQTACARAEREAAENHARSLEHQRRRIGLEERLEEVMYSRDLLRDRLSNLDELAREMLRRLRALDNR